MFEPPTSFVLQRQRKQLYLASGLQGSQMSCYWTWNWCLPVFKIWKGLKCKTCWSFGLWGSCLQKVLCFSMYRSCRTRLGRFVWPSEAQAFVRCFPVTNKPQEITSHFAPCIGLRPVLLPRPQVSATASQTSQLQLIVLGVGCSRRLPHVG